MFLIVKVNQRVFSPVIRILLFVPLVVASCVPRALPAAPVETGVESTQEGWYAVYFTDPGGPNSEILRGGPDAALAKAIGGARLSVEVAMDDLDLWSVRDALISAHRRGLSVRIVLEYDNLDSPEVQALKAAGVPVAGDRGPGLMHNKFAVIDRLEVWTGSMNFTLNGAYRSANNLVRVRSMQLAEDYRVEFEEMFVDGRFGPGSPADTPYPEVEIDGTRVEAYFSPDDGTVNRLMELIEGAEESIYFLAYSFTDDDLAGALVEKAEAGVRVAGVIDAGQAKGNMGSDYEFFRKFGLDVRLDGQPGSMHHKVILIDERIVVTGSYNFSQNARVRNDENTLILHDPEIASLYLDEFQRIFAAAQP